MDKALLHALYNYAVERADREVLSSYRFVRSAKSRSMYPWLEAMETFSVEEQRLRAKAQVKIPFQNFLPLWGDSFDPADLELTRSVGYRMNRTLGPPGPPMHGMTRVQRRAAFGQIHQRMASCFGFVQRKVKTTSTYMAEFHTDRACVDVGFCFAPWCILSMYYIVYPLGYQPIDYIGAVLSVNSPDYPSCRWSPGQFIGHSATTVFFDTDDDLKTACTDLCDEATSFVSELDSHFEATSS